MSDILAVLSSIDPLGFFFLGASLIFLWAIWRVLSDDIDLRTDSTEHEASPEPPVSEAPPAPDAAPPHDETTGVSSPQTPSKPRRPRRRGGDRVA